MAQAERTQTGRAQAGSTTTPDAATGCNEVRLRGKVAAEPEERELPSGDRLAQLRVIVPRELDARSRRGATTDGATPRRVQTIDTIDVVCWTARTRRSASRLRAGDHVEVTGALRRRFFGGAAGRQSRYEVEAATLRRVAGAPTRDT